MSAAFTPGPWTVSDSAPEEYAVSIHGAQLETGGFPIVADIPERTIHGTHEANARLIAAAPDLLEALRDALKAEEDAIASVAGWAGALGVHPDLLARIEKMRAAIAKAEGA